MKVKPNGNLLELIRAGAHLTKVPLTIDKCDWKVEVKLDAYCLGDVSSSRRSARSDGSVTDICRAPPPK